MSTVLNIKKMLMVKKYSAAFSKALYDIFFFRFQVLFKIRQRKKNHYDGKKSPITERQEHFSSLIFNWFD